eukprot:360214-Hanusia_phi.AAC.1
MLLKNTAKRRWESEQTDASRTRPPLSFASSPQLNVLFTTDNDGDDVRFGLHTDLHDSEDE